MKIFIFLIFTSLVTSLSCYAQQAPASMATQSKDFSFDMVKQNPTWNNFNLLMQQEESRDSITGISYIISGGVAIVGGLVGYYSSDDIFAKGVYSIAQTVGIGAVGYGAYTLSLGNDHQVFYDALKDSRSLTQRQRDELVRNYFHLEQERDRKTRTIKSITYGLVALLNGYNGFNSSSSDLRTALFFIAGVNLLASLSFAL